MSLISVFALFIGLIPLNIQVTNAESISFNQLREVDKGSFNEYGYKITKTYTNLDEIFKTDFIIDSTIANQLLVLIEEAYKYLPDDLSNEAKYRDAKVALKLGIKYPNNDTYFEKIRKSLEIFIEKPNIQKLKGSIISTPNEGNAPLISTLRAEIEDPSGTSISKGAYIWWMNINGKRTIIGTKPSISHTFTEEGTFTVFLDVKSSHKNSNGYRDVLPYSGSVKIKVKEKIASVILRISGKSLDYDNEITFSPDTASYGLIFDATSSVASSGTKFIETTWDFGNGVRKSYSGGPVIERVIYSREGNYDAILKLKTNNGKIIEKTSRVLIHKPIASIKASSTEGYMGDKFTFRAVSYGDTQYLTYSWEIIDTQKDKKIANKVGNIFLHSFKNKGQYSVSLEFKDGAGNIDVDTQTININSRAPIANFSTKIPFSNKPNKVFFDGTSSYDPDYSDDGNLKYSWTIDGQKVYLDESNEDGSNGFYTFSTVGDHSVILEVEDLDDITSTLRGSVKVSSLLDVDFSIYPRVVQREKTVRFIAESEEAEFYTWDFGDGENKSGKTSKLLILIQKVEYFQ
ncbi:MAG: PKD domain-containing protein [Candidatus Gracilibacteria bacterium]|nr:PKD domain-containing protein [Candidatus Gracilibacteria bacterium]